MAELRTNSRVADLLITLDQASREPLHRQIESAIRTQIRDGKLRRGSPLPPTRNLAATLGVSRGVVVEAYEQLTAEGYLSARTGGYTEVAIDPHPAGQLAAPAPPPRPRIDFRYGRADPAQFPRNAWLRAINRAVPAAPTERFNYLDGHGAIELRTALADYLNRVRGTAAHPDRIVITSGYAQAIGLLVQTLAATGATTLAIEDPSPHDDAVPVALAANMKVIGILVDDNGVQTDKLPNANAIVVTPSHQWPTGAVLAPERRTQLLAWAQETRAVIIEDDYDAEYRYDRAPIGAMQGLAPDRVAYAGTGSKTLAPGLRLGWLLLPAHMVEAVAEAKILADRGSPVIDQLAFADFITHGDFDRYLRRMRPIYRARRDALLAALAQHTPYLEPTGISAGFHLVAWLPPGLTEDAVVAAAERHDVGVYGLAPYRMTPGRPGLLFGYAGLTEQTIAAGVSGLAAAIAELRQ